VEAEMSPQQLREHLDAEIKAIEGGAGYNDWEPFSTWD
jgi:hypothetical protein